MRLFFWKKPETSLDCYDLFLPKERQIYSYVKEYKEGKPVIVTVDPMVIWSRISEVMAQLTIDYKLARSIHSENWKGHKSYCEKVRKIFEVKEYAEGGLTDREIYNLLDHFFEYEDSLKKNSSQSRISVETTSSSTPLSSAKEENSTTSNSLGSGSTVKENNTGEQQSSQMGQELRLEPTSLTTTTSPQSQMDMAKPHDFEQSMNLPDEQGNTNG